MLLDTTTFTTSLHVVFAKSGTNMWIAGPRGSYYVSKLT